jgi:hypothetical protein
MGATDGHVSFVCPRTLRIPLHVSVWIGYLMGTIRRKANGNALRRWVSMGENALEL